MFIQVCTTICVSEMCYMCVCVTSIKNEAVKTLHSPPELLCVYSK